MHSPWKSLTLLFSACLLNRIQYLSELYTVIPVLVSSSSMLSDIDAKQVKFFEVNNTIDFILVAFLPIPLVFPSQGLLVDFFKDLRTLIAFALIVSNLVSLIAASSMNSSLFYFSQLCYCIASSILFPAITKHISMIWPSQSYGFIFSCLVAQVPLSYGITSMMFPLCTVLR